MEALVRTVAHEVQDPLRAVATSCRSLEDRHGDILDDRAKELIDRALEGVSEVERLVAELSGNPQEKPPAPVPVERLIGRYRAAHDGSLPSSPPAPCRWNA